MNNYPKLILGILILLALHSCKKAEYKDTSKLKLKEVIDFSEWAEFPSSIKNNNSSGYLMHLDVNHDNILTLTDENFSEQKSYTNYHQIKDYIMLPDGRVLLSQFYFDENLVIISSDFSQREQFSLGLENTPSLHLVNDGIIMISANPNFGISRIVKYDFNFVEIWNSEFSGLRHYSSEYYAPTDQIYVVDKYFTLYEIDGINGSVTNSFTLSTAPENLMRENNYLYVFGYENDGTYCGDDLEVLKLNPDGSEIWNIQLGRKGANDHASDILVHDGLIFISGGYGELNCIEGVTSNHSDFYTAVISDDGKVLGHLVENVNEDYTTGSANSLVLSTENEIYLLGTKNSKYGDKKVALYKFCTDSFE